MVEKRPLAGFVWPGSGWRPAQLAGEAVEKQAAVSDAVRAAAGRQVAGVYRRPARVL